MNRSIGLVPATGESALRVERLAKTFRDSWGRRTVTLTDVTLEVRRGEVFGLLGPNGAGKSTTFKIILGLMKASSGGGELLGRPLGNRQSLARLGFLPENPYFYDYLTAQEFLDTCAALNGVPARERRARIRALLEKVGLDPDERRRLRKFSKGMLQRVGFAQAILHDPELVILDEPMSGLDPAGRRQFRDLILGLKDEGKTVIFASHVLPDVEALCDRVGILVKGALRRSGRLDELVPPGSAVEIEAAGLSPAQIDALSRTAGARRAGTRVLVRAETAGEVEPLVRRIFSLGGTLQAVRPIQATLESVFLSEIGADRAEDHDAHPVHGTRGAA